MMDDAICYNNFVLIDSCLPHIMANILVESNQANTKNLKEVTEQVATINPLNYDTTYNQQFYTHKVKNFFSGSCSWNGSSYAMEWNLSS